MSAKLVCRDESFNSITGLNGSGKSNILDSICFVLGITNMSTVRAQNLQVRRRHADSGAVANAYSSGPDLQARSSWRDQGKRDYCL
jgi:recombinational DNA repair ATPase RecF